MNLPIGLGIPEGPPPTLAERRKTRQLMVGDVGVGSEHPISVQSMTTTKTHDINATLQQIAQLTTTGCDIVRVAVPSADDAEALEAVERVVGVHLVRFGQREGLVCQWTRDDGGEVVTFTMEDVEKLSKERGSRTEGAPRK